MLRRIISSIEEQVIPEQRPEISMAKSGHFDEHIDFLNKYDCFADLDTFQNIKENIMRDERNYDETNVQINDNQYEPIIKNVKTRKESKLIRKTKKVKPRIKAMVEMMDVDTIMSELKTIGFDQKKERTDSLTLTKKIAERFRSNVGYDRLKLSTNKELNKIKVQTELDTDLRAYSKTLLASQGLKLKCDEDQEGFSELKEKKKIMNTYERKYKVGKEVERKYIPRGKSESELTKWKKEESFFNLSIQDYKVYMNKRDEHRNIKTKLIMTSCDYINETIALEDQVRHLGKEKTEEEKKILESNYELYKRAFGSEINHNKKRNKINQELNYDRDDDPDGSDSSDAEDYYSDISYDG